MSKVSIGRDEARTSHRTGVEAWVIIDRFNGRNER